ncbi:MAG: hypothetical protein NTY38_05520 [Acidobacteria bacterium]|nr:hypothetical protein [Acidobacteriota bacterium]
MRRLLIILLLGACAFAAAPSFDYDRGRPFDPRETSRSDAGALPLRELDFAGVSGERITAWLVRPKHAGPLPGILFVHGLIEPERSNKTQFLEEAKTLAAGGAVALLIDAMWSAPRWFERREPARDFEISIGQVKNLRRALDFLESQPDVDRSRIAYVAHDFGAMYGATMMGVERRPKAWALSAPTSLYAEWYLLGSKKTGAARQAVRDELGPLDPLRNLAAGAPAPIYLQFGRNDRYVPVDRARELAASAAEPKKAQWYEAGHELNEEASRDRIAWLREQLGMNSPR